MANRYVYQPLNQLTSDIRLLRLLPNDGNGKLKYIPACQIFHTSLDDNPKYVALSYVWGDTSNSQAILMDTYSVLVNMNLYEALMALRPSKEPIIIWIDFLCINQLDNKEKGWQVALMGNIYRQAQKVIAWLGPAKDSSDEVMDYLNELGKRADACGLAVGPEMCLSLWKALASNHPAIQEENKVFITAIQDLLHSIDGCHGRDSLLPMAGLKHLFSRPWWGRVWVLQEIALPHRAEFVCGTKHISRHRFRAAYNAYYALWQFVAFRSQQGQSPMGYDRKVFLTPSHKQKLMLSASMIQFPLLALLRATSVASVKSLGRDGYQHLESTNPLDKIYALLGLSKDRVDLERLGVYPDYEKSKEEVFMLVTTALLQQGHVSILSFCRSLQFPPGLPSWVPDWSRPMPKTLQDVEPNHMTLTPRFNASGVVTRPRDITILRSGEAINGISVACYMYDKIYQTGEVVRFPVIGTCIQPFDWLYEFLRLTYRGEIVYAGFYQRLCAVVRASVGGVTSGYDEFLERAKDHCLDARCLEALFILQQGMHKIEERDLRSELEAFVANQTVAESIQKAVKSAHGRLLMDYMRISAERSPFVTKKGHPGLSSQHIERGDIIALVRGAEVPFILRNHPDGKYTIVSEAYVDGIMDGEKAKGAVWENLKFI
jgi:hypothetical protein